MFENDRTTRNNDDAGAVTPPSPSNPARPGPGFTSGYLILMAQDTVSTGVRTLEEVSGISIHLADGESTPDLPERPVPGNAVLFEEIGVALVSALPEQIDELRGAPTNGSGIITIEPERVVSTFEIHVSKDYLRGYRDAINHLVNGLLDTGQQAGAFADWDETEVTWGLQATNVIASRYTGRGIKVAVLDTGLDLTHPDFADRLIVSESFVPGEEVQDGHGHGTHCIGTACGPSEPGQPPRYGIATGAEIYAGKVLSNAGSGVDGNILAGINWALRNGCSVISMSLGAPTRPGQPYSQVFETVARRARQRGAIIIAAAGNDSYRPDSVQPVAHPANCPSILAIGAVDQNLSVATFSNGGLNPDGGSIDLVGPGVAVRSSWPEPLLYRTINGTSMATPHAAGIAALIAEAEPDARGDTLVDRLLESARQIDGQPEDTGRGLVQAP